MNFGQAITSVFMNMFKFRGRASRSEYWYFQLFVGLIGLIFYVSAANGLPEYYLFMALPFSTSLFTVALLVANMAVTVRRLHDHDMAGWWILVAILVPYVGNLGLLLVNMLRGTIGINKYGQDSVKVRVVLALEDVYRLPAMLNTETRAAFDEAYSDKNYDLIWSILEEADVHSGEIYNFIKSIRSEG